ncbi:MAG: glycine--tRNA ligase subunit beta [Alphaproteobacteria bacterium]
MAELLLELLSEEIPARMQDRAAADLKRLVCAGLDEAGLAYERAEAFATPRRLALVIDGLPKKQPDTTVERKGPRVDAPEKAIAGFLKSVGLTLDELKVRETPKGAVLLAVIERKGQATVNVLKRIVPSAIESITWPKSMRWSDLNFRFIRPLHNVLCLFDGEVVNAPFKLDGSTFLVFEGRTFGHRFLAPHKIDVTCFADYRDKLRSAYVMLDAAERRKVIEKDAARLAKAEGLTVKPDPALVAENAGLVEWPVVLVGAIDPEFMELPPEVLTTAMRHHQKYFALVDAEGRLAPRFLVVANIETADNGKRIVAGNERVLRARLADAKFFWDRDRTRPLMSRVADLDGVVFHAKLGSLGDKVKRIEALAVKIAGSVPGADEKAVHEAARLCKADLTTEMVGEFPELQGVIGRYYALEEGRDTAVAEAIAEHYAPQGPDDACPKAPVSVCVALTDKIDTLVGFWAIDEKPTGSKDPFALRRAALGVIRLIIENDLRLPLKKAFEFALIKGYVTESGPLSKAQVRKSLLDSHKDLLDFFADRLKVHLREKGVRHDLIAAVFALSHEDDLVRLLARVAALREFLAGDDGGHLLTAYRRAANIVRIEQKKDKCVYNGADVNPELLREAEEKTVAETLAEVARRSDTALADEDFARAMAALATLRQPVDALFDNVTVNCDDAELRENRLRLLSQIKGTMNQVADFSRIEGGER